MEQNLVHLPSLSFAESVSSVMKNLTNFNGRARRSELWWYYLLYAIMCIVASAVAMAFPYLLMTLSFILLLSVCAVTVRRLHDGGHSGLWVLASVLIGIASNIYCLNAGLLELTQTANPNPEDILKIYSDPVFMSLGRLLLWSTSSFWCSACKTARKKKTNMAPRLNMWRRALLCNKQRPCPAPQSA